MRRGPLRLGQVGGDLVGEAITGASSANTFGLWPLRFARTTMNNQQHGVGVVFAANADPLIDTAERDKQHSIDLRYQRLRVSPIAFANSKIATTRNELAREIRIYQTSVNFNAPFQFSADLPHEEVIIFPQLVICRGVRNRNLRSVRCRNLLGPNEPHLRHKPAHQHTNQTTEENLCHFLQPAPNSSCGGGADNAGGDNQGR